MPQDSAQPVPKPTSPPFGIGSHHLESRSPPWRRGLLSLVLIGGPLLAAMLGLLGGTGPSATRVRTPAALLVVETPAILRSGNWFETLVTVEPTEDVADLTIALDQPLWRAMSIDTLAPDAEKSEAKDGTFSYSFGPLRRGQRFVLKLDGQIQPRGFRVLRGRVAASDGDRLLAAVALSTKVLP